MGKDPHIDAEKELNRAELYFKLNEFKIARECYSYAAKSFDFEDRPDLTIENLRNAGDSSLLIDEFSISNKFFKTTIRHIPSLKKAENRNFYFVFFSSLSYLYPFLFP